MGTFEGQKGRSLMAENREQMQGATQGAQQGQSRRGIPLEQLRQMRHESRTSRTYTEFIKRLCERGGMSPHVAEQAAVSVLCAVEQRIFGEEARDMEAQLPQKLVQLLHRCERHEGPPPKKFGRAELLYMVGEDLRLKPEAVEPVIRAVFSALQDQISDGEAEQVVNQLPHHIRDLGRRAV
jgi:uncharacterized protein (DUF2267 family)